MSGDINNSGSTTGLDVIYGVTYLKGGPAPPYSCDCSPHGALYVAGDVNGSCTFTGLDISYFVSFLKGGPELTSCPDCPSSPAVSLKPTPILDSNSDRSIGQ